MLQLVGSMYSRGKFNERINSYGMVIMDECHHAASTTSMELLQKNKCKIRVWCFCYA